MSVYILHNALLVAVLLISLGGLGNARLLKEKGGVGLEMILFVVLIGSWMGVGGGGVGA